MPQTHCNPTAVLGSRLGISIAYQAMEAAGKESQKFIEPGVWGRSQHQPRNGSGQLLLSDRKRLLKKRGRNLSFHLFFAILVLTYSMGRWTFNPSHAKGSFNNQDLWEGVIAFSR